MRLTIFGATGGTGTARLTDRPATGRYRTAVDRNPPRAFSLPRADLAAYILGVLSDRSTVHQHIGIAS